MRKLSRNHMFSVLGNRELFWEILWQSSDFKLQLRNFFVNVVKHLQVKKTLKSYTGG